MVRAFSDTGLGGPQSELVLPWALALTACVLATMATSNKTWLSFTIGVAVLAGGGLLMLASVAALGDAQTLATGGPYRWVRHPFYLALLIMLAGVILSARSLVGALLYVPAVALTLMRARREEHNLQRRFGARHRTYCRRVPFILPFRRPAPSGPKHDRGEHDE